MKAGEATELGRKIAGLVQAGEPGRAYALLAPAFAQRTPFPLLVCIGEAFATAPEKAVDGFLDHIASERNEGGWVVIGSALGTRLGRNRADVFAQCRDFVVRGDVWYVADILGERVPGPALVGDFEPSLALLTSWREDPDRWVRRAAGVAIHFWAKRSRGDAGSAARARELLDFLEPAFEEHDPDAIKGLGWGLKTLGKYYPDPTAAWLERQLVRRSRRPRALMLRKALTYLSPAQRARATKGTAR
jgi:3-methyladenine DNA glycosylase AlkD